LPSLAYLETEAAIMDIIPKRNPVIIWKDIQGESVLLNPENGRYYGLNKVGRAFWEKADGSRSLTEISDLLLTEFEVERPRLMKDLDALMETLTENGLITPF
jgi:hypothetical protein